MYGLRRLSATVLLAGAALGAGAAGLQVSPVGLRLQATQQSDGLWLTNTGDGVLSAQVRVFRWTQERGEDRLLPAESLQVSPPMLELPAGGRQLVRVIRVGARADAGVQQAYRVLADELPLDTPGRKGLNFVMRHSLPVFLEPAGVAAATPQLHLALRASSEGAVLLEARNSGAGAAQLADLRFTGATGLPVQVHPGLLGYVLPGATMRWKLKQTPAVLAGAQVWQMRLDGIDGVQTVEPLSSPR